MRNEVPGGEIRERSQVSGPEEFSLRKEIWERRAEGWLAFRHPAKCCYVTTIEGRMTCRGRADFSYRDEKRGSSSPDLPEVFWRAPKKSPREDTVPTSGQSAPSARPNSLHVQRSCACMECPDSKRIRERSHVSTEAEISLRNEKPTAQGFPESQRAGNCSYVQTIGRRSGGARFRWLLSGAVGAKCGYETTIQVVDRS